MGAELLWDGTCYCSAIGVILCAATGQASLCKTKGCTCCSDLKKRCTSAGASGLSACGSVGSVALSDHVSLVKQPVALSSIMEPLSGFSRLHSCLPSSFHRRPIYFEDVNVTANLHMPAVPPPPRPQHPPTHRAEPLRLAPILIPAQRLHVIRQPLTSRSRMSDCLGRFLRPRIHTWAYPYLLRASPAR